MAGIRRANVRFISGFDINTRPFPRAKNRPTGIAISANGDYIVADNADKLVKVFNKMGQLKVDFGLGVLKQPWDVTILSNGNIAVTDPGVPDIKIFSIRGEFVKSFACASSLKQPFGLHPDKDGHVLVTSKGDDAVFVCDNEGSLLHTIKPKADDQSTEGPLLNCPVYVCTDKADNVIVSDSVSRSVVGMSRDGRLLFKYTLESGGIPQGIEVDSSGNILVADSKNEQLLLLSAQGTFMQTLLTSKQGLEKPTAVTVNPEQHLVVAEGTTGEIKTYDYLTI